QYRSSSARSVAAELGAGADIVLGAVCPTPNVLASKNTHTTAPLWTKILSIGAFKRLSPPRMLANILRRSDPARHDPFGLSAFFCAWWRTAALQTQTSSRIE